MNSIYTIEPVSNREKLQMSGGSVFHSTGGAMLFRYISVISMGLILSSCSYTSEYKYEKFDKSAKSISIHAGAGTTNKMFKRYFSEMGMEIKAFMGFKGISEAKDSVTVSYKELQTRYLLWQPYPNLRNCNLTFSLIDLKSGKEVVTFYEEKGRHECKYKDFKAKLDQLLLQ